jgi:hypothetical protein
VASLGVRPQFIGNSAAMSNDDAAHVTGGLTCRSPQWRPESIASPSVALLERSRSIFFSTTGNVA